VTNSAALRQGSGKFTPSDIDVSLCTHVILGYASINNNILQHTGHTDDGKQN